MPAWQLYARNWEETISTGCVAVFFTWMAPRTESLTWFGADHSNMVRVIAMTLKSTDYGRRLDRRDITAHTLNGQRCPHFSNVSHCSIQPPVNMSQQ